MSYITGDATQDAATLEQCTESAFLTQSPEEEWLHAMETGISPDGLGAVVSPGDVDRDLGGTAIDARASIFDGLF